MVEIPDKNEKGGEEDLLGELCGMTDDVAL
jgi:hypothetical protein